MTRPLVSFAKWPFVLLAVFLLSALAIAGEIHRGDGTTIVAAMEEANLAALAAAKRKDTGWKPAKIESVEDHPDGSFSAYAHSANHRGSLRHEGYLLPADTDAVRAEARREASKPRKALGTPTKAVIVGSWDNPAGGKPIVFREDGSVTVGTAKGRWEVDGAEIVVTLEGNNPRTWRLKLSADRRRLTGTWSDPSGQSGQLNLDRKGPWYGKRRFLAFAAIYERFKGDRSQAKVVIDEVRELEGPETLLEKEFRQEVQSKYTTSYSTWVIHLIPESTYAVVYSFTMRAGRTKGIAIAEGQSKQEAERAMENQLKSFLRHDGQILRWWPR